MEFNSGFKGLKDEKHDKFVVIKYTISIIENLLECKIHREIHRNLSYNWDFYHAHAIVPYSTSYE